jgi:hypothetical protein
MAVTSKPHPAADEELKLETEAAQSTGLVTPASWWRIGLVALLAVVALLLIGQLLSGNRQTDVIPGTPITAPQTNVPVPVS